MGGSAKSLIKGGTASKNEARVIDGALLVTGIVSGGGSGGTSPVVVETWQWSKDFAPAAGAASAVEITVYEELTAVVSVQSTDDVRVELYEDVIVTGRGLQEAPFNLLRSGSDDPEIFDPDVTVVTGRLLETAVTAGQFESQEWILSPSPGDRHYAVKVFNLGAGATDISITVRYTK